MIINKSIEIRNKKIALYGLGTETQRLISEHGSEFNIVGLLDGFKESGDAFGYPIISLREAIDLGAEVILVVARPGSCRVIAKRIKEECIENGVLVFDVRGNDLLIETEIKYDYSGLKTYKKDELLSAIDKADIVSFDLFDTLVTRKVFFYTDIFELMEKENDKLNGSDFSKLRLAAEKELSACESPSLIKIYGRVCDESLNINYSKEELANLEWETDRKTMALRENMKEIVLYAKEKGKKLVLTTDCYYSEDTVRKLLSDFELDYFDELFVSCEKNVLKTNGLFKLLKEYGEGSKILHIGDDEWADIEKAKEAGINAFKIYSGKELFEALGNLGLEPVIESLTDRIRTGIFVERLFSDPFQFESDNTKVQIKKAKDVGFSLLSPVIIDFMLWMINEAKKERIESILLCARDGFIPEKIYNRLTDDKKAVYFLTSRIAAIRAGIENQNDIKYVESMNFFGSKKESMLARYGIDESELCGNTEELIIKKAETLRKNYLKYIDSLNLRKGTLGVFDFVAKGTTQLFLKKLFKQPLKGLFFLQLEPEFMADKGIEIKSFYEEKERDTSAIFNYFYVLEAVLTSDTPTINEFNEEGNPVYSKETRSAESLDCIKRIWEGIFEYLDEYIALVPESLRIVNKTLDEALLSLVGKLEINDKGFNNLILEDPFFGRNTAIKDVI